MSGCATGVGRQRWLTTASEEVQCALADSKAADVSLEQWKECCWAQGRRRRRWAKEGNEWGGSGVVVRRRMAGWQMAGWMGELAERRALSSSGMLVKVESGHKQQHNGHQTPPAASTALSHCRQRCDDHSYS